MVVDVRAEKQWDDLVCRLAKYGIHYLMSDGASSTTEPHRPEQGASDSEDTELVSLVLNLARARHARLRDALIALFLRHPPAADAGRIAAGDLPTTDPARRLILLSTVVAAALQKEWAFTLDLYLPRQTPIDALDLAAEFGLPSPAQDYGRLCLIAASNVLARDAPFPYDFRAGWEDATRRLLAQLRQDTRDGAA